MCSTCGYLVRALNSWPRGLGWSTAGQRAVGLCKTPNSDSLSLELKVKMDSNKWSWNMKKCCGLACWIGLLWTGLLWTGLLWTSLLWTGFPFQEGVHVATLWVWKLRRGLTTSFCKNVAQFVFILTSINHHTYYKLGAYRPVCTQALWW